jgi:hypothetical protein
MRHAKSHFVHDRRVGRTIHIVPALRHPLDPEETPIGAAAGEGEAALTDASIDRALASDDARQHAGAGGRSLSVSCWVCHRGAVLAVTGPPRAASNNRATSSGLRTVGIVRGSRTKVRCRAISGRSGVTVKKKRSAATDPLMLGARTPVCV